MELTISIGVKTYRLWPLPIWLFVVLVDGRWARTFVGYPRILSVEWDGWRPDITVETAMWPEWKGS